MIPEPYRTRLIVAGKAGDSDMVNQITREARVAHPHIFSNVTCRECRNQTPSGEVVKCIPHSQIRSPDLNRQCAEFEVRLK